MALYIMREMPDIHKKGERILYPQLAMIDQVSTERLAKEVAECSGFNIGDIEGVLKQVSIVMAREMAEGHSVKIDDIGTFTPSLALREGKEREEAGEGGQHRNAQSIVVGNVNFRVDMDLVRNINRRCTLERAPYKIRRSSQKYTPEQRQALAMKYLEDHPFLTVYEYQKLTGLAHTTAANELRQWYQQPEAEIDIQGQGAHRVYVKRRS